MPALFKKRGPGIIEHVRYAVHVVTINKETVQVGMQHFSPWARVSCIGTINRGSKNALQHGENKGYTDLMHTMHC